jgi:AraC family transcriptional regulator
MNKPATVLDYSRRIERVARHIGAHLDQPLELGALAEVACFSPCHFHRIYRALTGETVAETIRRHRLHRAAGELVQGQAPIAAVARHAGYGSVHAFTRAFRAAYGIPPAAYRQRATWSPPPIPPVFEDSTMHDVEIQTRQGVRLAALRHAGSYMEIGHSFERLQLWAAGRGLITPGARSIGIYYDDPAAVPAAELRSDACVSVAPEVGCDSGIRIVDLPGGRHAVLRHKGPYAQLETAYSWLYREWLPSSGEEAADRPCFEEYLNDPRQLPPEEWLTDVCLPLTER